MKTLIETERLLLREITLEDKAEMFRLHSNADVQKFTGEPLVETVEEMERAILARISDYGKFGYGRWATIRKDGMKFIGWAGLAYLPEFDKIDLGYRFSPQYWGKGFATEACKAILDHGFNTLDLDLIISIAMPENLASIKVMQKVGMRFDKQAPYDDEITDAIWYRLSKSDYATS